MLESRKFSLDQRKRKSIDKRRESRSEVSIFDLEEGIASEEKLRRKAGGSEKKEPEIKNKLHDTLLLI